MLWLAAIGCGGPTTQESFPEDYSEASCDWLQHCQDDFSSDYESHSDCVDQFLAEIEIPEDCDFDQARAQSCIDTIRENDCSKDEFEGGDCYRICGGGDSG